MSNKTDSVTGKKIRVLEMLIKQNENMIRARLLDGTFQKPDKSRNKWSSKVTKYLAFVENNTVLKKLLNKAKQKQIL